MYFMGTLCSSLRIKLQPFTSYILTSGAFVEIENQVRMEAIKAKLRIEVFKLCEWIIEITPLSVKDNLR